MTYKMAATYLDKLPATTDGDAMRFLNNYWFQLAASIFDRVVEICELDEDQIDSLKSVAMKPMAFNVEVMTSLLPEQ